MHYTHHTLTDYYTHTIRTYIMHTIYMMHTLYFYAVYTHRTLTDYPYNIHYTLTDYPYNNRNNLPYTDLMHTPFAHTIRTYIMLTLTDYPYNKHPEHTIHVSSDTYGTYEDTYGTYEDTYTQNTPYTHTIRTYIMLTLTDYPYNIHYIHLCIIHTPYTYRLSL